MAPRVSPIPSWAPAIRLAVAAPLLLAVLCATAQVPESFTVQGLLTQPDGTPVDGTVTIAAKLYNAEKGGLVLWENYEQQVQVTKGVYEIILADYGLDFLPFDQSLWLELNVGGTVLSPRTRLRSAPYALGVRGMSIRRMGTSDINIIGGYHGNQAVGQVSGVVIAGGGTGGATPSINEVHSDFSVVSGGRGNKAGTGLNTNGRLATISGGADNEAWGLASTVSGGEGNEAHYDHSTVSGGKSNTAQGGHATVGGGQDNEAQDGWNTIAGGRWGLTQNYFATVGGGRSNHATAEAATVPGGSNNEAGGRFALAAGRQAKALHAGAFVWADSYGDASNGSDFASTGTDQFLIRAAGGVGINTTSPGGVSLAVNGGIRARGGTPGSSGVSNNGYAFFGNGGDTDGGMFSTADGILQFFTNNNERMRIDAAGGVGINTTNPGGISLAVNGGIRARGGTPGAYGANNNGYSFSGNGGDNDAGMFSTADGQIEFYTNNGEKMRIKGYFVGIGTTEPKDMLHVVDPFGGSLIHVGAAAKGGPNGMVFEDDQEGLGVQLVWRTTDNLLTLERDVATGQSSARLVYDRDEDFFEMKIPKVQADNVSSPAGHVLQVRNTSTDVRGDVLALSVAATSPGADNNFITFFKGGTTPIGAVQANSAGTGITVSSSSADYAEMLPRIDPAEELSPGDIVGVFEGRISRRTSAAYRAMVVTDRPTVLGNVPDPDQESRYEAVAFLGQVPVRVRGPVAVGDYVVPSGSGDGFGVALEPEAVSLRDVGRIVGRVWSTTSDKPGHVVVEVGLGRSDILARLVERQQGDIERLQAQIDRLVRLVGEGPSEETARAGR